MDMLKQFVQLFGVKIKAVPERVGLLGRELAPLDLIFDLLQGLKGRLFISFGKNESATWVRLFEQLLRDRPVPERTQRGEFLATRCPANVAALFLFRGSFGNVLLELAVGQCAEGFLGSDQPHEMPHVYGCRLERSRFQGARRDSLLINCEQFTEGNCAELLRPAG